MTNRNRQRFEVRDGTLHIQLEAAEFFVAARGDTAAHVTTIAWPHVDDEVREILAAFREAGLPAAGLVVRDLDAPLDADD